MLEREDKYLLKREDLQILLEVATESKGVDYKSAVKFDEGTEFAAKLVKHILGFANSGGGSIIIGYKEQPNGSPAPDPDITDGIIASYEVTRLCQYVEKFLGGQDKIKIRIPKEEFGGTEYPIITIYRFQQYPCVCTRDYPPPPTQEPILKAGQVYIRTEGARTLVAVTFRRDNS